MNKPYLIAEIGVNFYDTAKSLNIEPIEAAKLYIDKAAEAGVDCAKFQSYKANTIVSKNSPAYWDTTKEPTKTQYELFLKHDSFGEKEYRELCDYTHEKGLDFTSTPFDYASVDYLEDMVDFYKISTAESYGVFGICVGIILVTSLVLYFLNDKFMWLFGKIVNKEK